MSELCDNCQYFGGLHSNIPCHCGRSHDQYWCFAERRYLFDTRQECPLFKAMVPDGALCTHTKMAECHPPKDGKPGCGHFYCPTCGLEWDEGCDFPKPGPPIDLP